VAKSRNATARKVGTAGTDPAKSLIYGGSDGARTRDLRRDRPTLLAESATISNTRDSESRREHGGKRPKVSHRAARF
jgi:hypothetical protein